MTHSPRPIFLSAEWRNLVMVNYAVDPAILAPHVPVGTELDVWNGTHYVSLVAFNFLRTRVKGLAIPFHEDFEEINLRFYVRRKDGNAWKRGVVFIKEIVPKPAIAIVARALYNENYVAHPTRHRFEPTGDGFTVRYEWRAGGRWNALGATVKGPAHPLVEGAEAQFIAEHYWGYTRQRDGGTVEYRVDHPSWNAWSALDTVVDIDAEPLYGPAFAHALRAKPTSAFVADGSAVTVSHGAELAEDNAALVS